MPNFDGRKPEPPFLTAQELAEPILASAFVLMDFADRIDPILLFDTLDNLKQYVKCFRAHHLGIVVREVRPDHSGGVTLKKWVWMVQEKSWMEV